MLNPPSADSRNSNPDAVSVEIDVTANGEANIFNFDFQFRFKCFLFINATDTIQPIDRGHGQRVNDEQEQAGACGGASMSLPHMHGSSRITSTEFSRGSCRIPISLVSLSRSSIVDHCFSAQESLHCNWPRIERLDHAMKLRASNDWQERFRGETANLDLNEKWRQIGM
jgi:hypothetical protein